MRAHTHRCIYVHTCSQCTYIQVHAGTHTHVHTNICTQHTYVYMYMYTYTHASIPHTHTEDELTEHADFMKNQNKTARHDQSIHQGTADRKTPATPSACSLGQSVTLTCGTGVVLRLTAPAPSCLPGRGMGWGAPQLGKWPSPPPPAAEETRKDRGLPLSLPPESQIPCCFVVPGAFLHTVILLISEPINFSQARHGQKMLCIQA